MTTEDIVACARTWLGTPYIHQASLKGVGCDCLGLLRGIWRELIGEEPEKIIPYSGDWAEASKHEYLIQMAKKYFDEYSFEERKDGDIVLFRWKDYLPAKHIALLTPNNFMIHAHDSACVSEVKFNSWWQRHACGFFRFKHTE